jgi:hypothetical protein
LIHFSVFLYDRFWTDRVRFFWGHRLAVYRFWSVSKSDIIKSAFLGCFWGFSVGVFCLFSTGLFWPIYCPKRCTASLFRQSAILYTSMHTEGCSRQPNLQSGVWWTNANKYGTIAPQVEGCCLRADWNWDWDSNQNTNSQHKQTFKDGHQKRPVKMSNWKRGKKAKRVHKKQEPKNRLWYAGNYW